MDEAAVIRGLQQGVTAAVAASTAPTLPVSYINTKFTKPNDKKWLELVHIPNNINAGYWGGEKDYRGILRMIMHWPNDGQGVYAPLAILESISDYFTSGRLLQGVQISGIPDFTGAIFQGDELLLPVSVRYHSFRKGQT